MNSEKKKLESNYSSVTTENTHQTIRTVKLQTVSVTVVQKEEFPGILFAYPVLFKALAEVVPYAVA